MLLGLNAQQGAAFLLEGEAPELWLVDLSGRARERAPKLQALGAMRELKYDSGGARWRLSQGSRRIDAYSIVRVDLPPARTNRAHAIAHAWCAGGDGR